MALIAFDKIECFFFQHNTSKNIKQIFTLEIKNYKFNI